MLCLSFLVGLQLYLYLSEFVAFELGLLVIY